MKNGIALATTLVVLSILFEMGRRDTATSSIKHRSYYSDGSLDAEWSVDSEGREHGELVRYYPNGQVREVLWMYHGMILSRSPELGPDGKPITPK